MVSATSKLIDALTQRLQLGEDRLDDARDKYDFDLGKLRTQVAEQAAAINELRNIPTVARQFERLNRANTEVSSSVSDLQAFTASLSFQQPDKIYAPTVTITPPKISAALYVADIRLTFDALEKERYSELTMRVFNGTGRVIEFVNLSGHIKFNAPNNTDPSRMGELPMPTLRADVAKSVIQLQEWILTFEQRVPAAEADKILAMLESDIQISFDLSGLTIEVADHDKPQEIERLPLWHGVSYRRSFGFGRIISSLGNIAIADSFNAKE